MSAREPGVGPPITVDSGGYPCFTEVEMARRRSLVREVMDEAGAEYAVCYGAERSGSAVQWLTGWPVTREAALVICPSREPVLFVQHANHVSNAERMAPGVDVRWGGTATLETVASLLDEVAPRDARVATIGALPALGGGPLARAVRLDRQYARLRLRKSPEELEFMAFGAQLTDRAVERLAMDAAVGMTEIECSALLESAFLPAGGTNHIHYLCSTPMAAPVRNVPAQWPSYRRLEAADALICEVSVSYFGYPGQLLRTFSVGVDAEPSYLMLHAAAERTFAAVASAALPGATVGALREAAREVERSGYSTCDDLVHGFGGGYLAPLLPGGGRAGGTSDDFVLEESMTFVIQPNPVDPASGAGVQTGELGVVTADGWQSMHRFPAGLRRIA